MIDGIKEMLRYFESRTPLVILRKRKAGRVALDNFIGLCVARHDNYRLSPSQTER